MAAVGFAGGKLGTRATILGFSDSQSPISNHWDGHVPWICRVIIRKAVVWTDACFNLSGARVSV